MFLYSIRTKLTLALLLSAVLPTLWIGLNTYHISQKALQDRIGQGLHQQAVRAMDEVDRILYERYQNVQIWSIDPIMRKLQEGDSEQRISHFLSLRRQIYKLFSEIICVNTEGKVIASSHSRMVGADVSKSDWFKKALKSEDTIINDIEKLEPFGDYGMRITAPIRPRVIPSQEKIHGVFTGPAVSPENSEKVKNEIIGVIAATLNWSEIVNLVNTIPILEEIGQNQDAYALVIDSKGLVLTQPYFSEKQIILKTNLEEFGLRSAKLATQGQSGFVVEKGLYGAQQLISFGSSKGYRDFKGLGWSLFIFQSTWQAFEPIRNLRERVFIAGFIIALIAFAFAFLLGKAFSFPIKKLTRLTMIIAQKGDLDQEVSIQSRDEIGVLASSFKKMVNELKKYQSELIAAKDFIENTVRSIMNSLIVVNPDMSIRSVNPATCSLLGYSEEELLGKPISRILSEEKSINFASLAGILNVEKTYQTKDKRHVPVLFSASIIKNREGSEEGIICVGEDISERKRLESSLLQSEKMAAIGQLAGGVAHEINNPLGVILGFSQNVVKRIKQGDPLEMPLKSIEREAIRCKNLVQDLLTFSRVSKTAKESVDLKEAVESALSLVLAQSKVKNVELVKEFSEVPSIVGNKNQIQQIIVNLSNNAMDAMSKGGRLVIRLREAKMEGKDAVEIQVQDTGHGIPPEIQSKIFNPFFTTKEIGRGTGLGLSLVFEIIQKHNGQILLDSEVGKGTTFHVFLPLKS